MKVRFHQRNTQGGGGGGAPSALLGGGEAGPAWLPLFTSQLLASWAWGLGGPPGSVPSGSNAWEPSTPQAAGHDLPHPSPSQTRRALSSLSQRIRTRFQWSGKTHRDPHGRSPVPPTSGEVSGMRVLLLPDLSSEAHQPTGNQRPNGLKKGVSGVVSRTGQRLGFFFFFFFPFCNNHVAQGS